MKQFSNQDLDKNLSSLIKQERELLSEIILHIREVDRRRLYLHLNYPSLFDYLTKHHGYANGSAQRRIDAARLSAEVPNLLNDIESGDINLSQVSLLQKSIRHSHNPTSAAMKCEIVQILKEKSMQESEVIIANRLQLEIKQDTKLIHQADESVRLEISFSKEQWQKLLMMRDLLSHALPDGSWDQVLEHVADKVIRSRSAVKAVGVTKIADNSSGSNSLFILRKQVLERDKCCQHRNSSEGKVCGSTWQLQVDHIQPKWAGGEDRIDNLQLLCAKHNRERYRQQSGVRRA